MNAEDNGFKPLEGWFTFENRCLVCGAKVGGPFNNRWDHINAHIKEGCMVARQRGEQKIFDYQQVRAHPAGFPGILLPKELEWSK